MCLSEHWLHSLIATKLSISNYKISSEYSRKIMKHGGALIMPVTDLKTTSVSSLVNLTVESNFEPAAIKLSLNSTVYFVLCLYPSWNFNLFLHKLKQYFNLISQNMQCCNNYCVWWF